MTEYKGTETFKPSGISSIFTDKTLKLDKDSERVDGDEQLVSDREWYVFNANYGTSEEKKFVRMLDAQMDGLKEKYDGIYLVRNERHFKIYNFDDGQAFEPDFVLFLREKNGNTLIRQIFIEPKGKYLQPHEKWKEDFLKQIKEKFAGEVLVLKTQSETHKYRPIGVPRSMTTKMKGSSWKALSPYYSSRHTPYAVIPRVHSFKSSLIVLMNQYSPSCFESRSYRGGAICV